MNNRERQKAFWLGWCAGVASFYFAVVWVGIIWGL